MQEFIIRIIICYVLSVLIGIERQLHNKITGVRTNVLVSLGAFLFVYYSFGPYIEGDQMRIAASVVSGIGFLGAGVILRNGNRITGLNTAATLWCAAAIGVLTARGMLTEAIVGTILILFSNVLLRFISLKIQKKVKKEKSVKYTINLTCDDALDIIIRTKIADVVEKNKYKLDSLEKNYLDKDTIKLKFNIIASESEVMKTLVKELSQETGVSKFSWDHTKKAEEDEEEELLEDEI